MRDLPIDSLYRGTWFKLICGASYGHLPAIYNLTIAYALAGADCIDVAADPAAIAAVRSGLDVSRQFLAEARGRGYPAVDRPLIMASLNDGEDPHFRKAVFDPNACPPDCDRPCERICPADAIPPHGAIVEDKCYGCGRCVPICPYDKIETIERQVEPSQILPHIINGEIDAIEIHTQLSHRAEFTHLWQQLAPAIDRLQLLSISCPDGDGAIEYLRSIGEIIGDSESQPANLMWQTDGRPMSGDIGAGTTHAAIRFGAKVAAAKLPGFVQLAGGTNSYTASKLRELNLLPSAGKPNYISGIAYGSYARVLLSPILERLETRAENSGKLAAHPDLLWQAVDRAYQLVGQLKWSQESEVNFGVLSPLTFNLSPFPSPHLIVNTQHPSISRMSAENQNLSLGRMEITDDLGQLLIILPEAIRVELEQHPKLGTLVEVVLDLGRHPEARFPDGAEYISDRVITKADLQFSIDRVGIFSGDNRAGIERTLHRISAMRNRSGEIIGLTCRVGRAIYGTINMIRDLVETGQSILMLGRPGVGKTTALREIARVLADELDKRVVIVDTSNEIAGDGDIPHPAIGRARRMQVARPELQHQIMIEAVENHMPQVIVIDEIGTELEALAARTIAERGVQLVGTAHGNQLANLIKNPTLSDLVGGIQAVTLGDDEARRRASQKTILERKAPPTFEIAVEMQERSRWVVHESVSEMVDNLLRGRQVTPQIRTVNDEGKVTITREPPSVDRNGLLPAPPLSSNPKSPPRGWRTDGRMMPPTAPAAAPMKTSVEPSMGFGQLLERDWDDAEANIYSGANLGPNGEDLPLHVYPYGISKQQLDQVIEVLNLPVVLTKDMDGADAVLALRTHIKNHAKLRQVSKARQLPIYSVKSGTIPQITRTLRRMLNMDEPGIPDAGDLRLFTQDGSEDEIEALEEARLAVEQIVIPKGQPVELLPRSNKVRKMQHELIEHYRLKSMSFGEEPNRRLRIFPA